MDLKSCVFRTNSYSDEVEASQVRIVDDPDWREYNVRPGSYDGYFKVRHKVHGRQRQLTFHFLFEDLNHIDRGPQFENIHLNTDPALNQAWFGHVTFHIAEIVQLWHAMQELVPTLLNYDIKHVELLGLSAETLEEHVVWVDRKLRAEPFFTDFASIPNLEELFLEDRRERLVF